MTRQSALRIRMDLALPTEVGDLEEFSKSVEKLEQLKKAVITAGFLFSGEIISKVGTFDFNPEHTPE